MTDVMEQHDHQNFEVFAYYCGINRSDATRQIYQNLGVKDSIALRAVS